MELETAMISGLEYKVVQKGAKKFAYYNPYGDWLGSTMEVWKIEQAIEDAKNPEPKADAQSRKQDSYKSTKIVSSTSIKGKLLRRLASVNSPITAIELLKRESIKEASGRRVIRDLYDERKIVRCDDVRTEASSYPLQTWRISERYRQEYAA